MSLLKKLDEDLITASEKIRKAEAFCIEDGKGCCKEPADR